LIAFLSRLSGEVLAGGVISSSRFIKREGRPSENEILTGRVIDRSLRPLFDQRSRNEVQIMASPLSIDGVEEPEILAVIAASAAVSISDYPWAGP
jgi:polyribonucleotide nucleotidyltransferase